MFLALWNLRSLTARSSSTILRGRLFHACNVDHLPSHKDPVKHREYLDRANAAQKLLRLKDPIGYRNRQRGYNEEHYHGKLGNAQYYTERSRRPDVKAKRQQYRSQPYYKRMAGLRNLILHRPQIWRHLEWKTHTPVVYASKTKHECASCHTNPYLGFKMWWKRNENPDMYDCHACFAADESRAMPIGYEDFVFGHGTTFRLHDMGKSTTTAPDSKEKGQ